MLIKLFKNSKNGWKNLKKILKFTILFNLIFLNFFKKIVNYFVIYLNFRLIKLITNSQNWSKKIQKISKIQIFIHLNFPDFSVFFWIFFVDLPDDRRGPFHLPQFIRCDPDTKQVNQTLFRFLLLLLLFPQAFNIFFSATIPTNFPIIHFYYSTTRPCAFSFGFIITSVNFGVVVLFSPRRRTCRLTQISGLLVRLHVTSFKNFIWIKLAKNSEKFKFHFLKIFIQMKSDE